MSSIHILANTETCILYEMPPGKPNHNLPREPGVDARERIDQEGDVSGSCWSRTFNWLRERIGKHPTAQFIEARRIEEICSRRRKRAKGMGCSLEIFSLFRDLELKLWGDDIVREKLQGNVGVYIKPYFERFVAQEKYKNFYDFMVDYQYGHRVRANREFLEHFEIDPKELYDKRAIEHGFKESFEELSPLELLTFLEVEAKKLTAEKYGLKKAKWTPLSSIDDLIKELKEVGPIAIVGEIGRNFFPSEPIQLEEKIGRRFIYTCFEPYRDRGLKVYHAVLIVGAGKNGQAEESVVYFIDPADPSKVHDKNAQQIYRIGYDILKSRCVNEDHFLPEDHFSLSYAYYGNVSFAQERS